MVYNTVAIYDSGGKLWDHISNYVSQAMSSSCSPQQTAASTAPAANIYSGRRLLIEPCQEALDYDQHDDNAQEPNPIDGRFEYERNKCKKGIGGKSANLLDEKLFKNAATGIKRVTKEYNIVFNDEDIIKGEETRKSDVSKSVKMTPSSAVINDYVNINKDKNDNPDVSANEPGISKKTNVSDGKQLHSLEAASHSFKDSVESPSLYEPKSGNEGLDWTNNDPDLTTMDNTSMFSSRFTTGSELVARSGMARYVKMDTSSCASDTTIAGN